MSQQFGRYTVVKPLDSGGMAHLYLAHDPHLKRDVAIKVPQVNRLTVAGRQRFEREAHAVAGLDNCPEIVPLYDFGEQDGAPYLVMRYMDGGTLEKRIVKTNPFSLAAALPVIERIARALDHAHRRNIVHRDVKPANILFDKEGRAYLSDFGIATAPDPELDDDMTSETRLRLTAYGASPGTPGYRSPEQAQGELALNGRSDVYSLGIVLFVMLAGEVPPQASVPRIADYRPDLPPELQSIFQRSLAKDRDDRYAKASELAADLRRLVDGGPGVGGPGGGALKGLPVVVLAVVAVLAVALAAFALLNVDQDGESEPDPTVIMTVVTPTDEPADEPTDETADEPTDEPPDEPTDEPTDEPPDEPTDEPPDEPTDEPPDDPTDDPTDPPGPGARTIDIGRTARGTPIEAVRFGNGPQKLIFIGGLVGGYAPSTVELARVAVEHFRANPDQIPPELTLIIIPSASPDAPRAQGEFRGRLNGNGVDMNRNWDCEWEASFSWGGQFRRGNGGTAPFSEAESRLLRDFILEENPAAVVAWQPQARAGLVSPGGCGPAVLVSDFPAEIYSRASGYEKDDFGNLPGAVVHGDPTNWMDWVGIPAISVLLPSLTSVDWPPNRDGMLALMSEYARLPLPPPISTPVPGTRPTTADTDAPEPQSCAAEPASRWSALWSDHRARLGCAQNNSRQPESAFQYYARGTMVWRGDRELVYVLSNNGSFSTHNALAAPQGYRHSDLLKGAFGHLWNSNAAVRDRLGEPVTTERNAADFSVQDFAGGAIFYFNDNGGYTFVLFDDDSTWRGN